MQQKVNLAPTGTAIVFSVDEDGVRILEQTEKTADELLAGLSRPAGRPAEKAEQAVELIRELLADGEEHKAADCEARLREAGIGSSTAKRAKAILIVRSSKHRFEWLWSLPECDDEQTF